MQTNSGTIIVSVGSNVIQGVGTLFTQEAAAGDWICPLGLGQFFQINAIASDTLMTVTSAAKGLTGQSVGGLVYAIVDHFTPVLGLPMPTPHQQSVQTQQINRAWAILDREMPNPIP